MTKKILHNGKKGLAAMRKYRLTDMLPFIENPSQNRFGNGFKDNKKEFAASELFSLFTANIIKEDVVFTR